MEEYCFQIFKNEMDKGEIGIINEDVFRTSGGSNQIKVKRFEIGDFIRVINPTGTLYVVTDEVKREGAAPFMVSKRKITPIKNVEWKQLR